MAKRRKALGKALDWDNEDLDRLSELTDSDLESSMVFIAGGVGQVSVVVGQTRHVVTQGAKLWDSRLREDSRLIRG